MDKVENSCGCTKDNFCDFHRTHPEEYGKSVLKSAFETWFEQRGFWSTEEELCRRAWHARDAEVTALEAEIAEQKVTLAQVNEELQGYIGVLAGSQPLASQVVELKKEIAVLREPMGCGHLKACLVTRHNDFYQESTGSMEVAPPRIQECSGCTKEKLERAAFARKAAALILALAQSDLKVLDERDRETRDRAIEAIRKEFYQISKSGEVESGDVWDWHTKDYMKAVERALMKGGSR